MDKKQQTIHFENATADIFQFDNGTEVKEYHLMIHVSSARLSYSQQLEAVMGAYSQLVAGELKGAYAVFKRYFLSDAANQADEVITNDVTDCAKSIIQQAPLDGTKIALWVYMMTNVETGVTPSGLYEVRHGEFRHLWNGSAHNMAANSEYQTRLLFNESVGPIAYLLSGLTGTTALLGIAWVNQTIIGADTINRMPFVFINMYSAMQGVPQELLEAATMDGANAFQKLIHVTIPTISSIFGITFLEKLLQSFLIFELIFAMTAGGPGTFTQSVSIFIYRRAFQRSDYGMACAASFALALILLVPSLYLVRRNTRGEK